MRIIGGMEMVRYNNNRGVGITGGGVLGEIENSRFLSEHVSFIYLCEQDFFLRLFRNHVNYHFIFPKINKKGVGIRAGRLENFSKINKRGGGRLFGTRE